MAKWREAEPREVSGSLKEDGGIMQTDRIEFVWDGSHLLQEIHADRTHTYVYTDADSYEPLAQITDYQASRSPHETSNPDVGCVRYARGFCSNDPSPDAG